MNEAHWPQRETSDAPKEPKVLELLERVASHLIARQERQDATIREIQDRVQKFAVSADAVAEDAAHGEHGAWDQQSADALAAVYWGDAPRGPSVEPAAPVVTQTVAVPAPPVTSIADELSAFAVRVEAGLKSVDPSPGLAAVAKRLDEVGALLADPKRQAHDAVVASGLSAINSDIAALTGAVDRIGAKTERLKDVDQAIGGLGDRVERGVGTVVQRLDQVSTDLGQRFDTVTGALGQRLEKASSALGQSLVQANSALGQSLVQATNTLGQRLEERLSKPVRQPLDDAEITRMAQAVAKLMAAEAASVREMTLAPAAIAELAKSVATEVSKTLPKPENPRLTDDEVRRVTEAIGRALVQKTVATIQSTSRGDEKNTIELKQLIEASIHDKRQADEQVTAMLETMQQALIGLLDRMDAMERPASIAATAKSSAAELKPASEAPAASVPGAQPFNDVVPDFRAPPPPPPLSVAAAVAQNAGPQLPPTLPGASVPPPPPPPQAKTAGEPVSGDAPLGGERSKEDLIAAARRAASQAAQQQPVAKGAKEKKAKAKSSGGSALLDRRLLIAILAVVAAASAYMALMRKPGRPAADAPAVERPAQPVQPSKSGPAVPPAQPQKSGALITEPTTEVAEVRSSERLVPDAPENVQQLAVSAGSSGAIVLSSRPISPLEMLRQQEQEGIARMLGPRAEVAGVERASVSTVTAGEAAAAPERLTAPATVGPLSLRTAAQNGDPSAEFTVAARLGEGRGVSQDLEQAAIWYQRSAQRGFALSQYRLGTFYERGLGVPKDLARAQAWYRRAAEQGNVKAMHNLAVLLSSRENGAPDYATAATWFAKAAEYGLRDSQFNLAVLYESGLGVEQDYAKAYRYLALAARGGDAQAVKRLNVLRAKIPAAELGRIDEAVASWRAQNADRLANDPVAAGEAWRQGEGASG